MPELLLLEAPEPPASFPDTVDGALAGCLAPTLERLSINILCVAPKPGVPAGRVAPWLRFAAERVAGGLGLSVGPYALCGVGGEDLELRGCARAMLHILYSGWRSGILPLDTMLGEDLKLPTCGRAKTIVIHLVDLGWRLRIQPAGLFRSLTALSLSGVMEGSELTTLVCTQCPRLSTLCISVILVSDANVSIHSDSLCLLSLDAINAPHLEVAAPRLEELKLFPTFQTHISAPKLAKLFWHGGTYDPRNHWFADAATTGLLMLADASCC